MCEEKWERSNRVRVTAYKVQGRRAFDRRGAPIGRLFLRNAERRARNTEHGTQNAEHGTPEGEVLGEKVFFEN